MKQLLTPLAAAILILAFASCRENETTKPPVIATNTIDTLRDTVSVPLCRKVITGGLPNDSLFIRNDSVYRILQAIVKRTKICKDYVFAEIDFSKYDVIWMRHVFPDNYKSRYSLVRNDSTKEYISIAEAYRHIDSIVSDAMQYTDNYLYRIPKIPNDYTVRFIFQKTWIE
jgi:hypothetical protein